MPRDEGNRALTAVRGSAGATLEAARQVIVSVGSGEVNGDALRVLADAVLDDERVRLALEVRAGGVHAVRRAIELAALLLADSSVAEVNLAR